jgi:vancomycin resistance protein VanJ
VNAVNASKRRTRFPRLSRALRKLVLISAIAYPIALVVVIVLFLYVGEDAWFTALALYLPRVGFLLPLVPIVIGLVAYRERRLLHAQGVAFLLVLFPLMGFVLPGSADPSGAPKLRVMSFNTNAGYLGWDPVVAAIKEQRADVVLLHEVLLDHQGLEDRLKAAGFPHVEVSSQFVTASRFPILESVDPPRIPWEGRQRSPRFMRHVIQTPLGRVAFYNVHPLSPRGMLGIWRARAALVKLKSGELLEGDPQSDVHGNAGLRAKQLELVGRLATNEPLPVVIGGDLNVPGLSAAYHRSLSSFRDGFRDAGAGLGYTFPQKLPFMRLDRILAGQDFRFTSFEIACRDLSDHFCVVADLERPRDE